MTTDTMATLTNEDEPISRYMALYEGFYWRIYDNTCLQFCFGLSYRSREEADFAATNMNRLYVGILAVRSEIR
jgi:hypothetical protein